MLLGIEFLLLGFHTQNVETSKEAQAAGNGVAKNEIWFQRLRESIDDSVGIVVAALGAAGVVLLCASYFFMKAAPPATLTFSSGPEGSAFHKSALKYSKILEEKGVKVKVLTSKGSLENLEKLANPSSHVDIGFAQSGIKGKEIENLVSLGSVAYQPILVFYRGPHLDLLSGLNGKKVAIGAAGSGTRNFALTFLDANGVKGKTHLLDWEGDQAANALLHHEIDAAFFMGESASTDLLRKLMRSSEVHLFSFKQANGYMRKIDFLNILELPEGVIDFGQNIPSQNITLLGPTIELVATKRLHPAVSDLLLEAATQVHNRPGLFQKRGEFPSALEHAIPLSDDAARFYKSGKSFFYRFLPFWLASLVSRGLVIFLPVLVLLIPVLKSIPTLLRLRMRLKINRRYRELLALEKSFLKEEEVSKKELLRKEFDRIETSVNQMKVYAPFADQFYILRGHIDYVRQLLMKK